MDDFSIIDTTADNIAKYGICSYKDIRQDGFCRKIEWMKRRVPEGLRIKTLYSETGKTQGMIEYIPGDFCWRPVIAPGYMFIHCIFVGFKKDYKGKGYGTRLLEECIRDARQGNMSGVAVVTRDGTWMAKKEFFLKNGFTVVDTAPPDFQLLVLKFDERAPEPGFAGEWDKKLAPYREGLTILRSDQCPTLAKSVREISETAEKVYGIKPRIIELKSHEDAQASPCPFGAFCVIYDGKIVAHAPISNTRFKNIMNKMMK
jgi:GNAT superfamily N-acetyltransferase